MRDLAENWYSSGTSLGIGELVIGIVGVWAVFYVAKPPRRELAWQVRACVPLLNDQAHKMSAHVEVRVDGEPIKDPTVVEIRVFNRGRRDIPNSAFNDRQPLRMEVGTRVVKHLNRVSEPKDTTTPTIKVDDTGFVLLPGLIKKGQSITVLLLLDGAEPDVCVSASPLIDIPVRQRPVGVESTRLPALLTTPGAIAGAGGVTAGAVLADGVLVGATSAEGGALLVGAALFVAVSVANAIANRAEGRRTVDHGGHR